MNAMLQRFFEAAGCRTQTELAVFLGIRQSSVSDAKRRRVIPPEWLVTLLRQKNIHPDWVLTGTGPRFLLPMENLGAQAIPMPAIDKGSTLAYFSTRELAEEVAQRVSKPSQVLAANA